MWQALERDTCPGGYPTETVREVAREGGNRLDPVSAEEQKAGSGATYTEDAAPPEGEDLRFIA
jgi:hypothetical protein